MKKVFVAALAALFTLSCSTTTTISRPDVLKVKASHPTNHMVLEKAIVALGLIELGLEDVTVDIVPLRGKLVREARRNGQTLMAHVNGSGGHYVIRLSPNVNDWELFHVLSHELIHIFQFETGQLKLTGPGEVVYNGRLIRNFGDVPYKQRPWERDAFRDGFKLERKIKRTLRHK